MKALVMSTLESYRNMKKEDKAALVNVVSQVADSKTIPCVHYHTPANQCPFSDVQCIYIHDANLRQKGIPEAVLQTHIVISSRIRACSSPASAIMFLETLSR